MRTTTTLLLLSVTSLLGCSPDEEAPGDHTELPPSEVPSEAGKGRGEGGAEEVGGVGTGGATDEPFNPQRTEYDYDTSDDIDESTVSAGDASSIKLLFPKNNEQLTDIAVSFRVESTEGGSYELQVSQLKDFSGEIITHTPTRDRESGATKDEHDNIYFLTYQGNLEPGMEWVLEPGIWYWRVTDDGGQSYSDVRRLLVDDDEWSAPLGHEISPRQPLFFLRVGGRPIEYASDPKAALAGIIPDSMRESIVLDIGHSWYQFHKGQDFFQYSKEYDELGYKFGVDWGLASTLGRIISPGEVEVIYRDLPNFVGGEIAEMFYKYQAQEVDNSQMHAALEVSRKYGKFFMWADMNWKWNKWQPFAYEYYDLFQENDYGDYFVPVFKGTDPLGTYTSVSAIQGMKLAGMAPAIGMWSDMWTWEKVGEVDTLGLDYFFEHTHGSGQEKTFPFVQHMKQFLYGMSFGATVFTVEPELQWDWAVEPNELYTRYLLPFMRAVVEENIIPSEEAIGDNFHVVVDTEFASGNPGDSEPITYLPGNIWGDFLRSTIGIGNAPGYDETVDAGFADIQRAAYLEMMPESDRYPSGLPFLAKPGIPAPVVNGRTLDVVKMKDVTTQAGANQHINPHYPASSNEAFAVKIDQSIFVFNTYENHDLVQSYEVPVGAAGIQSLSGDIGLMNYVMGRARADRKSVFFQTNAHVMRDYDAGRYKLPTYNSVLRFTCESKPTLESDEMGAIKTSWDSGSKTFTVTVDHESAGAVNFVLR